MATLETAELIETSKDNAMKKAVGVGIGAFLSSLFIMGYIEIVGSNAVHRKVIYSGDKQYAKFLIEEDFAQRRKLVESERVFEGKWPVAIGYVRVDEYRYIVYYKPILMKSHTEDEIASAVLYMDGAGAVNDYANIYEVDPVFRQK